MKVKKSPLSFINTRLLESNIKVVITSSKNYTNDDVIKMSDKYDIDIDFARPKVEDNIMQVFMKASINDNQKVDGYKILCECVCMFTLDEANLTKDEINNLKNYSTLYITLNTLRNFILDATAKFPLGIYLLPSIDLNELIKQKTIIKQKKASIIKNKKA